MICIATLDHCANPSAILRECHRLLRPGGTIGIMNKVVFEGTRVQRLLLYLRVGLRKAFHLNFQGIFRGIAELRSNAEDRFHMHHFTTDAIRALCAECFTDIAVCVEGNVVFLAGFKPNRSK